MSNNTIPEGQSYFVNLSTSLRNFMSSQMNTADMRVKKAEDIFKNEKVCFMMTQDQGEIRNQMKNREKLRVKIAGCTDVLSKIGRMRNNEELCLLLKRVFWGKSEEEMFSVLANLSSLNPNQYRGRISESVIPENPFNITAARSTSPIRKYEAPQIARATSPSRKQTESPKRVGRASSPVQKQQERKLSPVQKQAESPKRTERITSPVQRASSPVQKQQERVTSPTRRRYEAPALGMR